MSNTPTTPCKLCLVPTQDLATSLCDACWVMTHEAFRSRWLPMETAPKDGTVVLLKWPKLYAHAITGYFDRIGWLPTRDTMYKTSEPEGWRPLPEV